MAKTIQQTIYKKLNDNKFLTDDELLIGFKIFSTLHALTAGIPQFELMNFESFRVTEEIKKIASERNLNL